MSKAQTTNRKKDKVDPYGQNFSRGLIPPQAKDIESAILGAMLLDKNAFDQAREILTPEAFYFESHKGIFEAICTLVSRSQPVDILTVCNQLRDMGQLESVGGAYYVTQLTNSVVSGANVEFHSRIVYQKFMKRELIKLGATLITEGYEDMTDPFETISSVEGTMFQITNSFKTNSYSSTDRILVDVIKEIEHLRNNQQDLSGVTSGYRSVDNITHGWQNTDLIILAARPGVGKTALGLNFAVNAVLRQDNPTPVGFISLEMSKGQLMKRILSMTTEIPLEKIARGRMDESDMKRLYAKGIQPMARAPLFIDDTPAMNIFELRSKLRRMKNKHGIGLVIVDYLQLMSGTNTGKNSNREQEISEISRGLKQIAKELNIPIIALSQLSRKVEERANKTPQLSDLRESGAIEQDADAVIFAHRPEYYGIHKDAMGTSTVGETELIFSKYRNGSPGSCKLAARLYIQKFEEPDPLMKSIMAVEKKDGVTQGFRQIETGDMFANQNDSDNN